MRPTLANGISGKYTRLSPMRVTENLIRLFRDLLIDKHLKALRTQYSIWFVFCIQKVTPQFFSCHTHLLLSQQSGLLLSGQLLHCHAS